MIAWFLTRHFLDRMMGERTAWFRRGDHLFLGLVYCAWWLPYAIGTRPEILGALGSAIALVLVARAVERRSLLPAAFGAMAAGLAFAAHPTGGVAFAPLLLAIPALWRIARRNGTVASAVARTVAVLSVGSVPLFAAFADASLHDFLVGSSRFAAVEKPLTWTDEAARYGLLLSGEPMGAFAKRAVVLVALVALLWFALLWVASRIRKTPLGFRMTLAGWSLAIGLVALWITTSKWTHHFGALSVLGPVLLATVFFLAPGVVREVLGGRRLPVWLLVLVPVSFLPPIIVSLQGPNSWAYAWGQFLYRAWVPPQVGSLGLASLKIWGPVLVLALVGVALLLRRRGLDWRSGGILFAATGVVSVFFLLSTGFLYGTFANAAVRGLSSYSVGAANLKDPSGRACLTEDAITLWDAPSGSALPAATGVAAVIPVAAPIAQTPAPEMIDPDALPLGGWPASDPPPAGDLDVWADSADGLSAARETGWYELPASLADRQRVAVLVGGTATDEDATGVIAQVGTRSGDRVTVRHELWLTDAAVRPGWRSITMDLGPADLGDGAVLRLVGVDGSTGAGKWFGFSEPRLADGVRMNDYVQHGEPTLVAWQSSFWFPCERPIRIADGILEPPAVATTWGNVAPDNIWVERRGGALAGVARIATVSTPATEMVEAGSLWGRVETFAYPYPTDGYTVSSTPRTAMGWSSPFGEASQIVAAKRAGVLR
ncbi:arabinosyltransferase domain-containing protein [Naasia aerilata]|uniref:arabinosyltransferase domain-containing protein n=1 Tax=Naasia aerilata TaxID=1162966 RepID=UPI0025735621|nr:arabinosyltransferase domain-containing protein [Naasia aerilata]